MPKVGTCDKHSVYAAGCEGCKERCRTKRRDTYRDKAYGRWTPERCDATPAREHIARLRDEHGMTLRQISAAAGIGRSNVNGIAAGTQTMAFRRTIDAICAIQKPAKDYGFVPAHGTARRLQALAAIGYGAVDLAPMLSADVQEVRRWRRQYRPQIIARRHRDIDDLFRRLSAVPGTSDRARADAKQYGWAPPLAWDDIDDPNEQPNLGESDDISDVVDIVAVGRVLDGHAPIAVLRNAAEEKALWLHWMRYRNEYGLDGPGLVDFGQRYGVTKQEADRIRTAAVGRPGRKTKTTTAASECRTNERKAA